jgi:hypothetical protein
MSYYIALFNKHQQKRLKELDSSEDERRGRKEEKT